MKGRGVWLGIAFVASLALVNPYVRGDGNGYYAWLVSPAVDGDFDFENQFRHADPIFQILMFEPDGRPRDGMRTATGRLGNQWSVGPAVLWTPWFMTAHAGVVMARHWVPSLAADGYSWPYRYLCAIGTAVYGALALLLGWRSARMLVPAGAATAAALLTWLGTPLLVYEYFLPFHVHALAAFGVAWFVWYWLSRRPLDTARMWMAWGAIAGLMAEIYQLNAVLLVIAAYEAIELLRRRGPRHAARCLTAFALAGVVIWLPQLIGKAVVYGTPWTTGYEDRFFFLSPRIVQTAFSAEHGLFSWTPAALAALIGLVLMARREATARVLLLAAAGFFLAVASYQNWHGQSSFGNRFFVSLTALAVIGLAEVGRRLAAAGGRARLAGGVVLALLVLWNLGLAFQWGTGIIPNRGPVDFVTAARNQVTVVPERAGRFLRLYFSSRSDAARAREEHDLHEAGPYDPTR